MADGMRRGADETGPTARRDAAPDGGRSALGKPAERIDWDGLMRLGLGALRLPSDQFWEMTPLELCRALEGAGLRPAPGVALDRGVLDRLMAAHPDGVRRE